MKFSYMVHAVFAFTISTFAAPLDPEDANGVELFRRQDEQIDLKAPIIAIPSQHWYVSRFYPIETKL